MMKYLILFLLLTLSSYAQIGSMSFDGTNDMVDVSGAETPFENSNTFTITFWGKDTTNTAGNGCFAFNRGNGTGQLFFIYPFNTTNGAGPRVFWNGSDSVDSNAGSNADGSWHFFVFISRDATDKEIYVDGVSGATSSTSQTLDSDLNQTFISNFGAAGTSQTCASEIANVRIYDKALSIAEMDMAMMCSNKPVGNIKGWWMLNQTTHPDLSGQGNNGSCTNCPTSQVEAPPSSWCG